MQPLTLDALRVLDAIDRRGSFAAAAQELHRVTSAVSYAIQKLEDELGVVLFDREGHRARLTPTGRLVLERGRELLAAAERLALEARELHDGWETELRIACDNVQEVDPLFPLVAEFHRERPATGIRLLDEVLGGPWEALETDRADIVIAGLVANAPPAGIRTELLGSVRFLMAAAPDHPAAREPAPLDEDVLRRHPVIAVADSSRVRPPYSVGLLARQTTITVSDFRAKEQALMAGLGIGTLPEHRLLPLVEAGRLVVLRTVALREPAPFVMAWKAAGGGRARRWFLHRIPAVWRRAILTSPDMTVASHPKA
ncbi:MAG: LysR family transcriptional regulator [Pseudomonadota bacterium]